MIYKLYNFTNLLIIIHNIIIFIYFCFNWYVCLHTTYNFLKFKLYFKFVIQIIWGKKIEVWLNCMCYGAPALYAYRGGKIPP